MKLWPYQEDTVEEFERKVAEGIRRILMVAPTGSGRSGCLRLQNGSCVSHDVAALVSRLPPMN